MPTDIRSFFGSDGSRFSQNEISKDKRLVHKKRGRPLKRIMSDSEDEEEETGKKKSTLVKNKSRENLKNEVAEQRTRATSPMVGEITSTSAYFGSTNKPRKSKPVVIPASSEDTFLTPQKTKRRSERISSDTPPQLSMPSNSTTRKRKLQSRQDDGSWDEDNDVSQLQAKTNGQKSSISDRANSLEGKFSDLDNIQPEPFIGEIGAAESTESANPLVKNDKKASKTTASHPPKRIERSHMQKSTQLTAKRKSTKTEDYDENSSPKPKKGKISSAKSDLAKKTIEVKSQVDDNASLEAIYASIPAVELPSSSIGANDVKKFDFRTGASNQRTPPSAGSKPLPTGAENCLAGLSFVFTGVLESLSREDGQELVKRYGGKITVAPSRKTSYVVLGTDAGPKKIATIQANNIKTIDEDGLFELIRRLPAHGGNGKAAAADEKKRQQEEQHVIKMAAEMNREEKSRQKEDGEHSKNLANGNLENSVVDNRLWTVKYAPSQISQICGNKGQVEKLQNWLRNFPKSKRTGFRLAGKDGSGIYRAVMIHGPPGIGKTTAAHLVAKAEGYDIVETNASDSRSKKLVETGLKGVLSTTSIQGYFAAQGHKVNSSLKKLVLIMDEVDGMSAGDRGGAGALAAVCKKTQIPMILICNDRRMPKMKPFDYITYDLAFRRPTTDQIRSRIMTIAYREGLKIPPNVVNALIEGSGADIRQIVNMISTAKLDQSGMDFDQGKSMSKSWEKHVVLKPWDIVGKILGPATFAPSSKATLNDKIELYFNDHEFSYLMLQENYLGTSPSQANLNTEKERALKVLDLVDNAASSISDGDLVDNMIHGSQQHWTLMPTHAIFSFVRPASFIYGSMAGHQTRFTQWLGKNSNQGKLFRLVKEIQGHTRLRCSGDRHEIRQQYIPVLWTRLINSLAVDGKDAIPMIIELMDSYFLTKEDFDAILELGVGPMDQDCVRIETQAKAAFTRTYNSQSHPLPFMKASNIAPRKLAKEKPDLEEAVEESDDADVLDDNFNEDVEDLDLSKDKYVKQPKKKPMQKKIAKRGAQEDDVKTDRQDDESTNGRKGGKGKAKAKARAKRI